MDKMNKIARMILLSGLLLWNIIPATAQQLVYHLPMCQVEMATGMRSSGKIYVVVAVLSIVLIGLFLYLFALDRKISRLERKNDNLTQ